MEDEEETMDRLPGEEPEETQEELRQEEESEEEHCKKEKHEEVIKYRMHQYQENPNMQITGEDAELVLDCDHCGPWVTEYVR